LDSFHQAELIFRNAQDRLHLAMLYTNQGMACRMAQRWEQAQASLEAAIVLWQQVGNVASQVNALDELAMLYIAQRRAQPALCTLQQALNLLQQIEQDPAYTVHHRNLTQHVEQAQALAATAP
jgi:tetratricopeptide (TPR) repeat protein